MVVNLLYVSFPSLLRVILFMIAIRPFWFLVYEFVVSPLRMRRNLGALAGSLLRAHSLKWTTYESPKIRRWFKKFEKGIHSIESK